MKGVNFGNWLVLEKWMSPDLFQGTGAEDEVWLNRLVDPGELSVKMKKHRDTYITEEDFKTVADHGMELIRIPVPYFIFGDVEPFSGCIEYLDKAFEWAEKYNLKILIDLHTVPGSQNGYDNGGLTGVCKWCKDPQAVEFALTVLERLAQRYAYREGLYGIEVLNEPISWLVYRTAPSTGKAVDKEEAEGSGYVPMAFLKQFYKDAYRRIRKYLPEQKKIIFSDGFRLGKWKDFFVKENMKNVVLDTHIYIFAMEMFVPFSARWIYQLYIKYNERLIRRAAKYTPVVVGEWCIEQKRSDKLANRNGKNQNEKKKIRARAYREIAEMQQKSWSVSEGWIYWSYQLYRDTQKSVNDKVSMDAWALSRVWKYHWWPGMEDGNE